MNTTGKTPSRRALLAWGAGAAVAASLPASGSAFAANASPAGSGAVAHAPADVAHAMAELEREHSARLGVYAHDTATGRTVRYRAQERFPVCSVFKTLAVAAVLRDLDRDGEFLARRVRYTAQEAGASGYAPVTGLPENLAHGMTIAELSDATIRFSDNAANLLLRELGGPTAVTRFARSTGDPVTRLDRWEPELNSAEPRRVTDTTTPHAIGRTYERLVLGSALEPAGWTVADKTGGGAYGTNNDVGLAWPPGRPPLVIAVLTTKPRPDAPADNPLIARTAALLATALAGG
ncbi:serine hydrolase [Streptomyces sp. AP-93]|uniref:serine hydrolase n=1 Tax=Streptomyces sp. AP-93 TaxID=2929048 RepID=UPI001FAF19A2|nr:serine hydrolase [Streptomyces sp. AP-93]MCJ0872034.1 serine hydrolase [Streptomyces sp. AP-93]